MSEFHSEYGWGWFPAHTKLNPKQFKSHAHYSIAIDDGIHRNTTNYGLGVHGVTMYDNNPDEGGNRIGELTWSAKRGEILDVHVDPAHRRKGVATALLHAAHKVASMKNVLPPVHSNDRSDMGEKWAKAVGGQLPPRMKLRRDS